MRFVEVAGAALSSTACILVECIHGFVLSAATRQPLSSRCREARNECVIPI